MNNDNDINSTEPNILDIDDINANGDIMFQKQEGTIRISSCNPNGINTSNLQSQLQQSMDLDIHLQCYSKVNTNNDYNNNTQEQNPPFFKDFLSRRVYVFYHV